MKVSRLTAAIMVLLLTCGAGVAQSKAPESEKKDQVYAEVVVQGVNLGDFLLVQMPSAETEIIEYQDGDDSLLRKRPGRTRYSNLIIKRSISDDNRIIEWYDGVKAGMVERRTITLIVKDARGQVVDTHTLLNAWPAAWQGGVFETAEFVLEDMERVVEEEEE